MSQAYRVTGMTCQGCVRAVTNAIKARVPSATIAVDLATGRVTVDGPIDAGAVAAAVEAAGFGFAGPA
jgi:copper chaperone